MSKIQVMSHLNSEKTITHVIKRRKTDKGEDYDVLEIGNDVTIFLHPDQTQGLKEALKLFEVDHHDTIVAVGIPFKEGPTEF